MTSPKFLDQETWRSVKSNATGYWGYIWRSRVVHIFKLDILCGYSSTLNPRSPLCVCEFMGGTFHSVSRPNKKGFGSPQVALLSHGISTID